MSRSVQGCFYALIALAVFCLPSAAQSLLPGPTVVVFGGAPFSGSLTDVQSNLIHSHWTAGAAVDIPVFGPLAFEPNIAVTRLTLPTDSTSPSTTRTMTTGDLNLKLGIPLNPFFIRPYVIGGIGLANISGIATKPTVDVGVGAGISLGGGLQLRPEVRFGHTLFSSQTFPRLNRFTLGIGYTF